MAYTVKDALEERRKRKEAEAKKKDTSDTGSVNAVEQALQNRQKRVAESIRAEYNGIIGDYNNSLDRFNNGYGQKAFAEEMTSKRLATDKIMGLKRKIESSRSYLGSKEADSYLSSLDEILSKYGDRGTVSQSRSKYETKAAYDDAVEQAGWYDKYSDMDAQARKDAIAKLEAGNGAVDTYGPLPSSEAEASRREYNWLKGYDYHVTNMEYDVPAAREEIENDEAALARYNELTEQIKQTEQRLTLADRYLDVIDKEATRKELEALYAERDAISITSGDIAAKRLEANQAEDYQALQSYNALMGNADFKTVGAYDNTVKDNEYNLVNAFVDGKPARLFGNYDNYYGEHLNEMTDDERILYNYIFSKQGKEEASKYLSALKDTLAQRAAGEMYAFVGNSDVLKTLYAIPSGLDQFKSGMESIFSEEAARTPSATQYAGGMMREDLGTGGKIIYDALSTVANMAPSIAAGTAAGFVNPVLGQWVGASLMGASAGGNAYAEALRNGYSEKQARTYGVLVGTSEAVLEKFVGGVIPFDKMGGIIDGLGKAAARVAGHIAVDSASEFAEEGLQSVLEQTILQNIAFGEQNGWGSIEWEEVLYNAALGALTGGTVSVARNVPGEIAQIQRQEILEGKSVIGDGDIDALMEIAHRAVERGGPYANRIQNLSNNVESDASARNIGRLSYAIDDARKAANKAEISETLANAGVSGRELKRAASGIAKAADGFEISDREYGAIQKFEAAKDAYRSATDSDSAIQTRNKKYVDAVIGKPTTYNAQRAENKAIENKEGSYEGAMPNAPAEAVVNATGEVSAIRSFAMANDGKMGIELENGEVVGIGEVSFNNSADAPVYEVVGSIKGITPAAANVLVSGYDPEDGLTATDYALGVKEAYSYGEMGIAKSALASTVSASMLSAKQLDNAYEVGRMAGEAAAAARVQNNKASSAGAKKAGSVVFENGASSDNLSAVQKTAVNTMKMLSEAFGISFHVYASRATESGRVYTDKNGKTVKAPSGWYEPSTGDIYIDLNAGNSGQGTMMFTLAHELTHFIKDWSPEKYRVLGNMLTEKLTAQGKNIDELIESEKVLAKKRGRNLSSEQAYDEVVAKAMEEMLVSENVQYELAELYEKDKALWQKIMDFIRDFIDHIKSVLSAYEGKQSDSAVAKMVRELGDALPELEQLYVDALADAGEVYSGMQIDIESESVAPVLSERTWSESEYVTLRNKTAETLKSVLGISKKQALKYIDDINSVAKMIADDRVRLDYEASPFGSAFVSNVEYGGSFDYTTLCTKRRLYTGTFSEIQKRLRNTALTPDDILRIRNMMIEAGYEATCGLCYVEGSRANMGKFAKEFIRLYKRDNPDAWIPDMADVNTPDGVESMRINHPEAYEKYEYFWNHYGKLQDSDPALFASQQKPKLYEARKEYKGEILDIFSNDTSVNKKNRNGGIRMQSFSDFEIVHMIDTMQVIMDMARVGLAGQAYTKVPAFARAFGSTGLKINLSLIAKGVDENGNLIFDDREGMPHETAFEIRNEFSKNVGTVLVIFTDEQLMAAMADPRIDYIIPFHRSQWKKGQYNAMGLPKGTKDYTYMQNEKLIRPTYHEYRGRMVKDKATNYMPNEYWDFSKSGKENAENYLDMCAKNNKRPKFYKLLDYDGKGRYSLKKDGSTDGYWKLLIDFKMYDNDGVGSQQNPVVPEFEIGYITEIMNEYRGGHSSYPIAHDIVDAFVQEYTGGQDERMFSDREDESVYDILGETERVVRENKVVDSDVKRLRELIRFHTEEDYGEMYTKTSLQTASKLIREYAGVKSPTPELVSMLDRFYRDIGDGKINTLDGMMEAATEIAAYIEFRREKTDAAKAYYDAVKRADPTVNGADATATADIIAEYEAAERVRDLAYEIYNNYWNMVTLKSFAGKKAAEIGRLKESHRKAMAELRQMRDDKVKATAEYYRDMVARVRENKNAKIDSMKQAYAESREKKRISRIKNEIKHRAERLTSMALHPTEGRYVPAYLIEAVAEVAKGVSYGMDAPAIHETGRYAGQPNLALEKRLKTREALDNLIKQYKDMGKDKDDTYRVEFDKIVLEQLERFRDKFGYEAKLDELSLENLIELNDILRTIGGTITDARKLIGETEMGDVYEAGDTLMDEMQEVGKRKDKNLLLNPIKAGTISAMRLVRAASGYNEDSVLYRLFKALEDGARKKSMFIMEAYDLFNPLVTGKNERNYYEATHTYAKPAKGFKPFTWEDVNGKKFSVTKMQMMQAVLTYRREVAGDYNHIRGGGLEFASLEEMNRGNMKNAVAANKIHRVYGDEAVRMIGEFENILKDDSWAHDYMEAATDFFNRVAKDAINDVSMKVKHRKIATEDAYIPFEVSEDFRIAQIDSTAMMQKTLENLGMLQNTKPNVSNPIVMAGLGNVLDHHIEDVAGVYGLMIPVRNINKVWNVKAPRNMDSARNAMKGVWGNKIIGYIEQAVRDVQSPKVTERNPILNWIRGNIVGSTFLLNLSVLLKQIGSRGYAASRLSAWNGSTTRSIGDFLYAVFNGKKILNESKKYTATLWERQQGLTNKEVATLRHSAPGIFKRGLKNLGYKVSDIVGRAIGKEVNLTGIGIGIDKLIQWMDFTVGASLWRATMAEVKKNNTDLTGEELLEETARLFDDIIDNTQSINDVLHTSHFQRNHNIVLDPLYMFKNDAYQMAGDLSDATGAFIANKTKDNGARLFKSLEGVARSMIWTSAVTVAMAFLRRREKRYRDEETGDITGKSVTKRIALDLSGEMAGILLPLGGSEIFELIDSIKDGGQYDILESIEYKALTDIITATAKFAGDMDEIDFDTEEGRNKLRENASEVLLKIAPVLGIPANNVKRAYDALMLHIEDVADGGEWFSSGVKRTRKQNLNRITGANDVSEGKDIFDEVIAISAEEKLQTLTENNEHLPVTLRKTPTELEEEAHKEALSDMKSLIGQTYYNGGMGKEETETYLREYFGMSESEIYWTMDKWDYHKTNGTSEGYGKYNTFIEAVSSGEGLKREIQRHLSHADSKPGETAAETEKRVKAALASAITSHFKPLMQEAATKGEQANIKARCLTAYSALGYSRSEKSRDIDAWLKE